MSHRRLASSRVSYLIAAHALNITIRVNALDVFRTARASIFQILKAPAPSCSSRVPIEPFNCAPASINPAACPRRAPQPPARRRRVPIFSEVPRTALRVFESRGSLMYSIPTLPLNPDMCPPQPTCIASANPQFVYYIFGLPATALRVFESHALDTHAAAEPRNSHFWWSRGVQRRTQILFGFPRAQDAPVALPTPRGGGVQRCLQCLFDVRAFREPNDASVALPTRRRPVAPPL
ncbi:hypothetical protein DFH09DRAFT_1340638 [Mycena vulgaris]|nr:hypothetical protein DFH09DRAFT_1340638 [Mycena vulgaris]